MSDQKTHICTCGSELLKVDWKGLVVSLNDSVWYLWSNHTVPMKIYVFYLFTRTIALFSSEIDTILYVVDGVSDGIICYGKNIRTIKLRFAQHSSDSVATTLHIHLSSMCYLDTDGEIQLFPYIKENLQWHRHNRMKKFFHKNKSSMASLGSPQVHNLMKESRFTLVNHHHPNFSYLKLGRVHLHVV